MFEPKIRLDKGLYETAKKVATAAGYSSVDEFVSHLLEKACADAQQVDSEAEVRKRLQGLGYIE
jgi:hypothetical protein